MDYGRVRSVLVGRLRRIGASSDDAEDCAQEALLAAWQAHASGSTPDDLQAWTTTVARRRFADLGRRAALRRSRGIAPDDQDRTAHTPEQRVIEHAHARWLTQRLRELPNATQAVCGLAAEGHGRTAIASRMGISVASVDSHLTRARRFLRKQAALGWAAVTAAGAWIARKQMAGTAAVATVAATVMLGPGPSVVGGVDAPVHPDGGTDRVLPASTAEPGPALRPPVHQTQHRGVAGEAGAPRTITPATNLPPSAPPAPARSRIAGPATPVPLAPRTALTVEVRPEAFRQHVADSVGQVGEDQRLATSGESPGVARRCAVRCE